MPSAAMNAIEVDFILLLDERSPALLTLMIKGNKL
jgi:hypothetical protein